jgi:hypothetical protein
MAMISRSSVVACLSAIAAISWAAVVAAVCLGGSMIAAGNDLSGGRPR